MHLFCISYEFQLIGLILNSGDSNTYYSRYHKCNKIDPISYDSTTVPHRYPEKTTVVVVVRAGRTKFRQWRHWIKLDNRWDTLPRRWGNLTWIDSPMIFILRSKTLLPTTSYYVPQPRPDVRSTANVLKRIFMMCYSARYPGVRSLPVFVERVLAFYSYVFMISGYERKIVKNRAEAWQESASRPDSSEARG